MRNAKKNVSWEANAIIAAIVFAAMLFAWGTAHADIQPVVSTSSMSTPVVQAVPTPAPAMSSAEATAIIERVVKVVVQDTEETIRHIENGVAYNHEGVDYAALAKQADAAVKTLGFEAVTGMSLSAARSMFGDTNQQLTSGQITVALVAVKALQSRTASSGGGWIFDANGNCKCFLGKYCPYNMAKKALTDLGNAVPPMTPNGIIDWQMRKMSPPPPSGSTTPTK